MFSILIALNKEWTSFGCFCSFVRDKKRERESKKSVRRPSVVREERKSKLYRREMNDLKNPSSSSSSSSKRRQQKEASVYCARAILILQNNWTTTEFWRRWRRCRRTRAATFAFISLLFFYYYTRVKKLSESSSCVVVVSLWGWFFKRKKKAKLYHDPTTYFSTPLKPSPRIQKKQKPLTRAKKCCVPRWKVLLVL